MPICIVQRWANNSVFKYYSNNIRIPNYSLTSGQQCQQFRAWCYLHLRWYYFFPMSSMNSGGFVRDACPPSLRAATGADTASGLRRGERFGNWYFFLKKNYERNWLTYYSIFVGNANCPTSVCRETRFPSRKPGFDYFSCLVNVFSSSFIEQRKKHWKEFDFSIHYIHSMHTNTGWFFLTVPP